MNTKIIIPFALLIVFNASAQDKLLLLSGRIDKGEITADKESIFDFKIYKNGGKEKIVSYDKSRIFSITTINGKESVLYKKDSSIGNFLSENRMRMYIYGQRDAHENFGIGRHFLGGFVLGFAATVFDTYEFGPSKEEVADGATPVPTGFFLRDPSVFPVLFPLSIPLGASLLPSKIIKDNVSSIEYLNSEEYVEGFSKVKKFKRIKSSFLGSLSGVVMGFICYYAINT
jgi:hypothetical protein